jgi:hypothetical protein
MARTPARPHNLAFLNRDRGYRFAERDPDMVELCNIISASELSVADICERVGQATKWAYTPAPGTVYNWLNGKTKRPTNHALTWVGWALGYRRSWTQS